MSKAAALTFNPNLFGLKEVVLKQVVAYSISLLHNSKFSIFWTEASQSYHMPVVGKSKALRGA